MAKKMSNLMKLFLVLVVIGILGAIGAFIGLYAKGEEATHVAGIDFSEYMMYLAIPAIVAILALLIAIPIYKGAKRKQKKPALIFLVLAIIGMFVVLWYGIFAVRCWTDNAKSADIAIDDQNYASGDFQINDAKIEAYHGKEEGGLWKYTRILRFDDKYRFVFEINATDFDPEYEDITATLQGFSIKREAVTGKYAPVAQPNDFEADGGPKVVVFEDVNRQDSNPQDLISYYNLSLWNDDGEIVASFIVHTNIELNKWTLDNEI